LRFSQSRRSNGNGSTIATGITASGVASASHLGAVFGGVHLDLTGANDDDGRFNNSGDNNTGGKERSGELHATAESA
jgi:hypothetical protein